MKKPLLFFAFLLVLLITQSCWAPKTLVTAENLTKPVLIGKVINIGDDTTKIHTLLVGEPFSASITNGLSVTSGYTFTYTQTFTQGHNAIDAQLLPICDKIQADSTSILIIDGCRVKAIGAYWLIAYLHMNRGRLDGHISKLSLTH